MSSMVSGSMSQCVGWAKSHTGPLGGLKQPRISTSPSHPPSNEIDISPSEPEGGRCSSYPSFPDSREMRIDLRLPAAMLRLHLVAVAAVAFLVPLSLCLKHAGHAQKAHQLPLSPAADGHKSSGITLNSTDVPEPLRYLIHAFDTLQGTFFSPESEDYPDAIDWTAAVIATHAVTALHTVLLSPLPHNTTSHVIDIYFPDIIGFYHSQNVGSLKNQAYDDMLWVVLGWLAAVRFLDAYRLFLPADYNWVYYSWRKDFAFRARQFYGYAEKGWDELFCGGGCIWNPNLQPYKNAITNELFIAASVQMYTTFPMEYEIVGEAGAEDHRAYLQNAEKAYRWLKGSNFTNTAGLIVDGFHISSYWKRLCDERDEQTFTYNQGVVLSGLRGLWEVTGNAEYLDDGYELVRSVVESEGKIGELVRKNVLEEHCDSWGWCNQDAQMFKGIFFHHLTAFCSPHPYAGTWNSTTEDHPAGLHEHLERCKLFFPFVAYSAAAAWSTRHAVSAVFGMWWSAPLFEKEPEFANMLLRGEVELKRDHRAVDRINGDRGRDWSAGATEAEVRLAAEGQARWDADVEGEEAVHIAGQGDLNDRFRGRTVETQSGGVGVMRAAWELGRYQQRT
ncbi:hypothetical protein Dda_0717 [Drechslerella dactyloides]|uniref:Uncharacterized protein n=1 Tax=Drechslerella dactyloides TaxID=74499 RepID=A0AAD6J6X5_DREDA|nr:hypothetical protein Dda_0717 [Drechslerella dactyloides]